MPVLASPSPSRNRLGLGSSSYISPSSSYSRSTSTFSSRTSSLDRSPYTTSSYISSYKYRYSVKRSDSTDSTAGKLNQEQDQEYRSTRDERKGWKQAESKGVILFLPLLIRRSMGEVHTSHNLDRFYKQQINREWHQLFVFERKRRIETRWIGLLFSNLRDCR